MKTYHDILAILEARIIRYETLVHAARSDGRPQSEVDSYLSAEFALLNAYREITGSPYHP